MNKTSVGIVIAGAVVLIMATIGYLLLQDRLGTPVAEQEQLRSRNELLQQQVAELQAQIDSLAQQEQTAPVEPAEPQVAADNATATPAAEAVPSVSERVARLFSSIDAKGYLRNRGVKEPAADVFANRLARLEQTRPVISGETQDMYTLLKNITYFYRALGKEATLAAADFLRSEDAMMEEAMALLFTWIDPWTDLPGQARPVLAKQMCYDYSSFFLSTIAGQSYLFRRSTRVRLLATYYALVVLDHACQEELNRNGIDIRPHLDGLMQEMQSTTILARRDAYLGRLTEMRSRY